MNLTESILLENRIKAVKTRIDDMKRKTTNKAALEVLSHMEDTAVNLGKLSENLSKLNVRKN